MFNGKDQEDCASAVSWWLDRVWDIDAYFMSVYTAKDGEVVLELGVDAVVGAWFTGEHKVGQLAIGRLYQTMEVDTSEN